MELGAMDPMASLRWRSWPRGGGDPRSPGAARRLAAGSAAGSLRRVPARTAGAADAGAARLVPPGPGARSPADAGGPAADGRASPGGRSGTLDLPPESFASGPVGGLVLVGDDDGSALAPAPAGPGARLRDAWSPREAAVIRSAVLDPDGARRSTSTAWTGPPGRDLGVWRRAIGAVGGRRGCSTGWHPRCRATAQRSPPSCSSRRTGAVVVRPAAGCLPDRVLDPATGPASPRRGHRPGCRA